MLSDLQTTYGVDAYKGVFNIKNIVSDLVSEVKNSSAAIDEVDQKFAGMISKYTDVSSVITPDPTAPRVMILPVMILRKKQDEKITALESFIAREKALIQQKYIDGQISMQEYNRQLEYLELERLRKSLEVAGLTFEQQKEIELKIFDTKQQMLQKIRDEETAHQEKLKEIQQKAEEARIQGNWKTLRSIAKQNEDNAKEQFEAENKRRADLTAIGMDFANDMGTLVGGAISGNEDIVASSLKSIINMGLDLLKVQVQMAIAGATAQSLAQPDSVATFGASGLARAAILVGLIEAAFSVVKSVVGSAIGNIGGKSSGSDSTAAAVTGSRVYDQRAAGKYDVIGADDGRLYSNVPYTGIAQTGFVSTPTLMGEQGRELVVSSPDLARLQRHINYPLIVNAINDARAGMVPQRAEGNYSQIQQPTITGTIPDSEILNRLSMAIEKLLKNGVRSAVVLSDIQREQYLHDTSRKNWFEMKIIHSSGESYDLFPDTKIELTRYNPFLNEVGEQSIPISLPATSKNLALLNYPQRGDGKQKPVQRLDAQLQSATYIVKARQAILSARNKGSIETSFYLNEGAFNEKN